MAVYGYIRVSSTNQNTARQFAALEKLEIPDKNLYVDKQSGKDFERPAYKKLLRKLILSHHRLHIVILNPPYR